MSLFCWLVIFVPWLQAFRADDFCLDKRIRLRNNDALFWGQIEEFFGQTSALIRVKNVHKGDKRYKNNFVIVENFQNCPERRRPIKIGQNRLFHALKIDLGRFHLKTWPALENWKFVNRFNKRHLQRGKTDFFENIWEDMMFPKRPPALPRQI